jgi:hypothetical protein
VIGLGIWGGVTVFGVKTRFSFYFFWLFFFFLTLIFFWHYRWCGLLMEVVDMVDGIIKLNGKILNLILEELNNGIALGNNRLPLVDLVLLVVDDHVTLGQQVDLGIRDSVKLIQLIKLLGDSSMVSLS